MCKCTGVMGTASQPEGAARRLGCEPWLKQQAVSLYDVGYCKTGAKCASVTAMYVISGLRFGIAMFRSVPLT